MYTCDICTRISGSKMLFPIRAGSRATTRSIAQIKGRSKAASGELSRNVRKQILPPTAVQSQMLHSLVIYFPTVLWLPILTHFTQFLSLQIFFLDFQNHQGISKRRFGKAWGRFSKGIGKSLKGLSRRNPKLLQFYLKDSITTGFDLCDFFRKFV